jgi:hypothetical protein
VLIVWLTAIGLTLGALSIRAFVARGWRGARHPDLGWMTQQWLAQCRAGSR